MRDFVRHRSRWRHQAASSVGSWAQAPYFCVPSSSLLFQPWLPIRPGFALAVDLAWSLDISSARAQSLRASCVIGLRAQVLTMEEVAKHNTKAVSMIYKTKYITLGISSIMATREARKAQTPGRLLGRAVRQGGCSVSAVWLGRPTT